MESCVYAKDTDSSLVAKYYLEEVASVLLPWPTSYSLVDHHALGNVSMRSISA